MKRLLFFVIIVLAIFGLYYLISDQVMVSYYASKTDQSKEKVQEYADQVEEYTEKVKTEVDNFDARVTLARSYEYMGRLEKATEVYKELGNEIGDDIAYVYYNNLGKLYEKQEKYEEAIAEYLKIIEKFDTQYPGVNLNLANTYLAVDNITEAEKYYFHYKALSGGSDGAFEQRLERAQAERANN